MSQKSRSNAKYIVVTVDGEELGFNSYQEIAEFFNVHISYVFALKHNQRAKLNGTIKGVYTRGERDNLRPIREQRLLKQRLLKGQAVQVNMLDRYTHEILKTFNSALEASEYLDWHENATSGIYQCARGVRKSAGGYKWEIIPLETVNTPDASYQTTGEIKYVLVYEGKEIRFSTQQEIAEHLNVGRGLVHATLSGEVTSLTKRGILLYTIAEYDELEPVRKHRIGPSKIKGGRSPRRIHMLDRYTNEILDTFSSVKEATEDLFVANNGYISRACRTGDTAYGYKWEYAD